MNKRKIWTGLLLILLCTLAMGVNVSAADKTMKNKKWMSGKGGAYIDEDKDGTIDSFKSSGRACYKIKITKQGYVKVNVKTSELPGMDEYNDYMRYELDEDIDEGCTNVYCLNAKKKELSSDSNSLSDNKDFSFTMAVKKGTYYLAVEGNQKYKLRYTFTPVAKVSKAGRKFAKAVTLKKGSTVKNLLFFEEEHYYKIKLSKKTKVTLAVNTKIECNFLPVTIVGMYVKQGGKYRMVNAKGKALTSEWSYTIEGIGGKKTVSYTLPKGTYYLSVGAVGSGYYTIKWK